jgi:hypothetical protein
MPYASPFLTADEFHEALHEEVGKPLHEQRTVQVGKTIFKEVVKDRGHRAAWAFAQVFLQGRDIKVQVNLNLKRNGLPWDDYQRLSRLVFRGIRQHWSRSIAIKRQAFEVDVNAIFNTGKAIEVDLSVETGRDYARSHNMSILGIDASFIYNRGFFTDAFDSDDDFMRTAAHEFGHSVLIGFGGLHHSWTHKGSTSLLQTTKASTPGYPSTGPIDLMKYYDWKKAAAAPWRRANNTRASELDVKCLLWLSKLSF